MRTGNFIHALKTLHDRYGPIVRYGPNELSFIDPRAWQDIYGHHGGEHNFPRNPLWYQRAPNGAHTILSADNDNHARIRKLLSHAFSERALKEQEYLLQVYFDRLIAQLRSQVGKKSVNILDWFHFTTFDITGDLEFGESFKCLENGKYHPWISVMLSHFQRLVIMASFLMIVPFVRPLLPFLIPKKVQEQRMQRFRFAHNQVGKRLDVGDDPRRADFITYVCRYNDAKGMSRAELDATFEVLVSAGSETTASALTGILHYLLRSPEQFDRLKGEIRSSFKHDADITIGNTSRLPYLSAVINEGLRLCPPTPTMLPRLVPKGGASVCGEWLPAGTSVGVPQWSMFRSLQNFGDPDSFLPQRWIDPSALMPHASKAFQPFSVGPRNCLGRNLAWTEIRIILAKLLWHFDIERRGELYDWKEQLAFVMWEKRPLNVALTLVQR